MIKNYINNSAKDKMRVGCSKAWRVGHGHFACAFVSREVL